MLVIAVAFSTLVWSASESEVQRASDQAAVKTAASSALMDLPASAIPSLAAGSYPVLSQQLVSQLLSSQPILGPCSTIGNPIGATSGLLNTGGLLGPVLSGLGIGSSSALTSAISLLPASMQSALSSLPTSCSGLGSITAYPSVGSNVLSDACATASAAVTDSTAPYSTRYFSGVSTDTQPTCTNGRVRVSYLSGSPLIGFGGGSAAVSNVLQLQAASGLSSVQADLASLGVHLDTALPNVMCPQVNVEVDQTVQGPVLSPTTTTTGRSSARRIIKNAVVVPVFNGLALSSVTSLATPAASGQATVSAGVTTNAVNLNSTLLAGQKALLGVLDTVNTQINNALTAANAGVSVLNGTTSTVSATGSGVLPAPLPAVAGNVGSLNLLSCLRKTLTQIYDPPTGDAPTVDEVLANAAATGDPVDLVQVGVVPCATATTAADPLSTGCLQAAGAQGAASAVSKLTGLYDVPLLDVTPALVRSVGNGNYMAVPVEAAQASGAFRAGLIRSTTDERYAP